MYLFREFVRRKGPYLFFVASFLMFDQSSGATKTWTGLAGDGQWATAANWNGGTLPVAGDDILLDNSSATANYAVMLPNVAIVVRSITINPDPGRTIQLTLPNSNTTEPALTATGPGYGLLINDGGVFENASGLTSGESLAIGDSLRINNGGRYIHRTKASHANNIARLLSSAPGTEKGIFEFNVPRASYTVSVSNRIYGTVIFNATAAGGGINYTCTGSNPFTVNGDLQINAGVNLSIDLASTNGNILVKGNFIQLGGQLNLASGAGNSTVMRIDGNVTQIPGSQITETNTGMPFIELNGSAVQQVSFGGTIVNSVGFRVNNAGGVVLMSPLQLPFKLELQRGKITSSQVNLLTLQNNCTLTVDTTNVNLSFVDGPVRKEGLASSQYFLFPVGKNNLMRWLELKNVTGNFTVEYTRDDPRQLANVYGSGLHHISSVEYWSVNADVTPVSVANVELSFKTPESGGVTDLNYLNVASLSAGIWQDAGHTGVTGNFNTSGSVVSNTIGNLDAIGYFTLASTVDLQNPLPVEIINFNGRRSNNATEFDWEIEMPEDVSGFDILAKTDGDFKVVAQIPATSGKTKYKFEYFAGLVTNYYRLRVIDKNGKIYLSKIISIDFSASDYIVAINPSIITDDMLHVRVNSPNSQNLEWLVSAIDGRVIRVGFMNVEPGSNLISLQLPTLPTGVYQIVIVNSEHQYRIERFVRR